MWNGVQRAVAQWNMREFSELMKLLALFKVTAGTCMLLLLFFTEGLFRFWYDSPYPNPPGPLHSLSF
jgi:hypothetical protein